MIIAQLCLAGIAFAAPPRLSPTLVSETRLAVDTVRARRPLATIADVQATQAAMARIRRGLNAYFHAPNLLDARADALAMRVVFRTLRQGDEPAMVLVGDVWRFSAALHERLADACVALGDRGCALRHRLSALTSGPSTPARVEAVRQLLPPKDRAVFDRGLARPIDQPPSIKARSGAPASRPE